MKSIVVFVLLIAPVVFYGSCSGEKGSGDGMSIILLHHSTGGVIWDGDLSQVNPDVVRDNPRLKSQIPLLFAQYNKETSKDYLIKEMSFPKAEPYGWNNYPFDYYNIWVKNSGVKAFMKEPTLEILTDQYNVIIFKHCFPSSNIVADDIEADINSDIKSLQNFKLQYEALRDKLHEFPDNKFILFTGAVQVRQFLTEEEAYRAREFHDWVTQEWDQPEDNIFLWDLYQLQTEEGLYFKDEYAVSPEDSHPNKTFAGRAATLLFNRIIDVIDNGGKTTTLAGVKL